MLIEQGYVQSSGGWECAHKIATKIYNKAGEFIGQRCATCHKVQFFKTGNQQAQGRLEL